MLELVKNVSWDRKMNPQKFKIIKKFSFYHSTHQKIYKITTQVVMGQILDYIKTDFDMT